MALEAPQSKSTGSEVSTHHPFLTRLEIERLTDLKWRFSLEPYGLSVRQALGLLFTKWRVKQMMKNDGVIAPGKRVIISSNMDTFLARVNEKARRSLPQLRSSFHLK